MMEKEDANKKEGLTVRLSVLDQSVVREGYTAKETFEQTVALAQLTEKLGYTRFWVAEHHNSFGMAGTSPEVLIAHIAAKTNHIRVGSGGVLLPQYSPFKIAENFKVLDALYPHRIDLGIGRSPGGSPETRMALTDGVRRSLNEFPRQIRDLKAFVSNNMPEGHPYENVTAYPLQPTLPEMWSLGVTHRGARLAAENGLAFTFGHFISPLNGKRAMEYYYRHFQPSELLEHPKANVCVFVVCADTQEKAEYIALSQELWLLAIANGERTMIPTYEDAHKRTLSYQDKKIIEENKNRMIVGSMENVREELLALSDLYETDEIMVINNVYDFQDKLKTYQLLAKMFL